MKHFVLASLILAAAEAAKLPSLGPITWKSGTATQVQIEVPLSVRVEEHQQKGKLILDLRGVRPNARRSRAYVVEDGVISQIRVGDHPPTRVRVVLDLETTGAAQVSRAPTGAVIVQAPRGEKLPRVISPHPARTPSPAPGKRRPPPAVSTALEQAPPPPESVPKPAEPSPETVIRILSTMELTILEDTTQEVPFVLQRYGGMIGFGPENEPLVNRLFGPPDWFPTPVIRGRGWLSEFFALQLSDDKSTVVDGLRKKYSIASTDRAYALFPLTFIDTLHAEIRREAAKQVGSGDVMAASVRFTMLDSGIEVKTVTVRP